MSHDIQLYSNPNLPAAPDDPWAHGSTALGPAGTQHHQASPIRKVQRLLRGRYHWAVILAVLGAFFGGYYGWSSQKQKWSSDGIVCIKPVIPSISGSERTVPVYDKFVQSQVNVISSERVQ